MQLTTPLVGAVFSIGAILSSCSGEAGTDFEQAISDSDAPVGATTAAVHGGTQNGICMVDRYNVTKPADVMELNCRSNDVQLAKYELISGPASCIEGEDIMVTLKGEFVATSAERWDVGVFVAQDGGTPNDLGGECYSDYLHPVSADNLDLNLTAGAGPFYNAEIAEDPMDACGDIQQGNNAFFTTAVITIKCQDSDNNNVADVDSCTVWANSRSDGGDKPSCIDEGDVTAQESPKCTCDAVEISGLAVPETGFLEVVKVLDPVTAPGKFNLQIDRATAGTGADVGDGGTTGQIKVSAGTSVDPGETHTVGEIAGTGTDLGDYETSIECKDQNGSGVVVASGFNAGPLDVLVDPDDVIVCTITNVGDPCEDVDCSGDNTACGIASCDPDGAFGNCEILTAEPLGTVCRASAGICDPAEVCDGTSTDCGPDLKSGTDVTCRGSAGFCDPAEVCDGASNDCGLDLKSGTDVTCRGSAGFCDPAEVCDGASNDCGLDLKSGTDVTCRGSAGFCDPAEVCDGASNDCGLDLKSGTDVTCRGSAGFCDPAEVCDGASNDCGLDLKSGTDVTCRGSAGFCDPAEVCDGASNDCGLDLKSGTDVTCRDSAGFCDPAEVCDGASNDCGLDLKSGTDVTCRDSAGFCDPAEVCDGASNDCGLDLKSGTDVTCRDSAGFCDPAEVCDGASNDCGLDLKSGTDVTCRDSAGFCDPAEVCDGASNGCGLDLKSGTDVTCRDSAGFCDPAEVCDGASNDCGLDLKSGTDVTCRDSAGFCDPAEVCDGASNDCGLDLKSGTDVTCRDSAGFCDPAEVCDGASNDCGLDLKEPEGTECDDDGNDCTDDECDGVGDQCVHTFDPANAAACAGICRTGGFWGTRGGDENGCNYTQVMLDAALEELGGCLEVCGNTVCATSEDVYGNSIGAGDLGTTGEGICVKNLPRADDENLSNQLYRAVLAATLNCVLTGAGLDQCAALIDPNLGEGTWETCALGNDQEPGACQDPTRPEAGDCNRKLDCWNNGLFWKDGGCAFGTCSVSGAPCEGKDFDPCPDYETCDQQNFCHDLGLCETGNDFLFTELQIECEGELICLEDSTTGKEELGAASSSRLCSQQTRSSCSFAQPENCTSSVCYDGICDN